MSNNRSTNSARNRFDRQMTRLTNTYRASNYSNNKPWNGSSRMRRDLDDTRDNDSEDYAAADAVYNRYYWPPAKPAVANTNNGRPRNARNADANGYANALRTTNNNNNNNRTNNRANSRNNTNRNRNNINRRINNSTNSNGNSNRYNSRTNYNSPNRSNNLNYPRNSRNNTNRSNNTNRHNNNEAPRVTPSIKAIRNWLRSL